MPVRVLALVLAGMHSYFESLVELRQPMNVVRVENQVIKIRTCSICCSTSCSTFDKKLPKLNL